MQISDNIQVRSGLAFGVAFIAPFCLNAIELKYSISIVLIIQTCLAICCFRKGVHLKQLTPILIAVVVGILIIVPAADMYKERKISEIRGTTMEMAAAIDLAVVRFSEDNNGDMPISLDDVAMEKYYIGVCNKYVEFQQLNYYRHIAIYYPPKIDTPLELVVPAIENGQVVAVCKVPKHGTTSVESSAISLVSFYATKWY
jgi:hypothetical protein